MNVDGYIVNILINVMCTVNIRGHEANFYEAEARCHEAEIEAEARKSEAKADAEAKWFGPEALTSLTCTIATHSSYQLCIPVSSVPSLLHQVGLATQSQNVKTKIN